jgi:hypothetical protein
MWIRQLVCNPGSRCINVLDTVQKKWFTGVNAYENENGDSVHKNVHLKIGIKKLPAEGIKELPAAGIKIFMQNMHTNLPFGCM